MAQQNLIGLMVREGLISFVRIDHTVFVKTIKEKRKIRNIAVAHKRALIRLGHDPKKTFNSKGISL